MSEEPNLFQRYDYYARIYDHEKGEWRMVNLSELSDEDFRRWLLWKLPRLSKRRPRAPAKPAKKKKEA